MEWDLTSLIISYLNSITKDLPGGKQQTNMLNIVSLLGHSRGFTPVFKIKNDEYIKKITV